jgi:predicted aldo/keto reductase-like oxidoreductase
MSEYQELAKQCKCCTKHVPLPTVMKLYNDLILCPTTYYNIIEYKRIWESFGSRPAGRVRKHFSEYVQQIVESTIDTSE